MGSNMKGWIGFAVLAIIVIGGAFGTSHILKQTLPGVTIADISATPRSGYYISANQTYVANVTGSTSTVNFTVNITSSFAAGGLNVSVISPAIFNASAYNSTYSSLYNSIYNKSVNSTIKSGIILNASVNASLQQNASRLASIYAYQNSTYMLFHPYDRNTTYTGGKAQFSFTLQLNSTALNNMTAGESAIAIVSVSSGAYSSSGFVEFVRV